MMPECIIIQGQGQFLFRIQHGPKCGHVGIFLYKRKMDKAHVSTWGNGDLVLWRPCLANGWGPPDDDDNDQINGL
jgi:hypothetical protein